MISSVNSALHRSMQYCFVQVGFFVIYDGNFFFGRGRMAILMACSNSLLGSLFGFFFFLIINEGRGSDTTLSYFYRPSAY